MPAEGYLGSGESSMDELESPEKVGVLHIHSTYSSDGTLSLAECQQVFRNRGYDFMAVTEHGQDFDAEKMKRFVEDCLSLSNQAFCVVPGLELEFYRDTKKTHILAIGITDFVADASPEGALDRVHDQGGVAILAHPRIDLHQEILQRLADRLDGIEVWNTKYNGHFAIPHNNLTLLAHLREAHPQLQGFAGIDFHWQSQYKDLYVALRAAGFHRQAIVSALRSGDFRIRKKQAVIDPGGQVLSMPTAADRLLGALQSPLRRSFQRARGISKWLGLPVPTALKRGVRRIIF